MMNRKERRDARVAYQMQGRDLPKAKMYYAWVWPIVNWMRGVLFHFEMWATDPYVPSDHYHQFNYNYNGLTQQQENTL
ncbi:MAG: hypothetical protein KKD44_27230, partial [Proteobacteria bacterium]|nr:hypothetical protein [Pseudomonadota bacterium]